MRHLSSIPQLAVALVVCAIVGFTASNAMATAQGGTPGVPIVIGEIKYTLDEAGTVSLPDSHIEKGQDFYVDVCGVIDTDSIGDPDPSHGAIGEIQLYRQVRDVGDTEWEEAWGTPVKVDSNPLNYNTNYYRFRVPYHETEIINTTQEVRYKAVAFDGESGSAHDDPKVKTDPEKLVAGVNRVVMTSAVMDASGASYVAPSADILLNGEAYDNGKDTQPSTADDVRIEGVSFSWAVNPSLGSLDETTGESVTFTAGSTAGTCTVTATYDPTGCNISGEATVNIFSVDIKKVEFTSDHGVLTDYDTDYAGLGGTVYNPRGWIKGGANNPITHVKGSKITANITFCVQPPGISFDLGGDGPIGALDFEKAGLTSSGADQTVSITSDAELPTKVDVLEASVAWSIDVSDSLSFEGGSSGPHKIYVTWGNPGPGPTLHRVNWVCDLAKSATSLSEIGNEVGPNATASSRFDSGAGSIFGSPPAYSTAWEVMDGNKADCGTLSTLMKYELDMLGAPGSAVKFVYARHSSWDGLVSDAPSYGVMEKRVAGDSDTRLGFISGSWNKYEGCCLFEGKYWMGGAGFAKTKAVDVLHQWVDPNSDPNGNHQCYHDQQGQVVAYPPPPEPVD